MAVTAWQGAGTGQTLAYAGGAAWSNPTRLTANDGSQATAGLFFSTSAHLRATNFGFSIPSGSTIDGVELEINRVNFGGAAPTDHTILLVSGSANTAADEIGTNKSAGEDWPASPAFKSFGGAADLWGATLTPAIINASNFGVTMRASGGNGSTPAVDFVRMRVYYTAPAGTNGTASGTIAFTGTGAGKTKAQGSATGTIAFTGTGTGTISFAPIAGASSGIFGLTGTASAAGAVGITASGAGIIELTGASEAANPVAGEASGALDITGAASGGIETPAVEGAASGDLPFSGSGQATVSITATGAGLVEFTGSAAARVKIGGGASGLLDFAGAAQANRRTPFPPSTARTANDNRPGRSAASLVADRTVASPVRSRTVATAVTSTRPLA